MSDLVIGEPLASRIREIARAENRSPEEIIERIVKYYPLLKKMLSFPRIDSLVDEALRESREDGEKTPKRSLYGLWKDVNVSAEDIDEARREMWGEFPREDIE